MREFSPSLTREQWQTLRHHLRENSDRLCAITYARTVRDFAPSLTREQWQTLRHHLREDSARLCAITYARTVRDFAPSLNESQPQLHQLRDSIKRSRRDFTVGGTDQLQRGTDQLQRGTYWCCALVFLQYIITIFFGAPLQRDHFRSHTVKRDYVCIFSVKRDYFSSLNQIL